MAPKLTHPHPRELGATRFFARLIAFDLECPRCGKVFQIRRLNKFKLAARALNEEGTNAVHTWNPVTARFTCVGTDGCQKIFILGMLAWEPSKGARSLATPEDQVPTYLQLEELKEELRAVGQGHRMPHHNTGRMSTTNLTNCDDRPEGHDDDEEV